MVAKIKDDSLLLTKVYAKFVRQTPLYLFCLSVNVFSYSCRIYCFVTSVKVVFFEAEQFSAGPLWRDPGQRSGIETLTQSPSNINYSLGVWLIKINDSD